MGVGICKDCGKQISFLERKSDFFCQCDLYTDLDKFLNLVSSVRDITDQWHDEFEDTFQDICYTPFIPDDKKEQAELIIKLIDDFINYLNLRIKDFKVVEKNNKD